jgi:hypothetical protein
MINDPALTFALTLKRWFKQNGWPQKITDDWAKDPGINNPHGPWASQMCGAMKADGYNPKADFFLSLGTFNRFVFDQQLITIQDTKLRDRLTDAKALLLESGEPYGASDFWSLYAGLLAAPGDLTEEEFTQEDCDLWVATMRDNFRKVSLKYLVSRPEAWELLVDEIKKQAAFKDHPLPIDDIDWLKSVLSGLHDPPLEECLRVAHRAEEMKSSPVVSAMESLLGEAESKKPLLTA